MVYMHVTGIECSPHFCILNSSRLHNQYHQIVKSSFQDVTFTRDSFLTNIRFKWGATIGTSTCRFFRYRLYNFTTTANGADPSINPAFLPQLQALCPANSDGSKHVALDTGSGGSFNLSYFTNFRNGRGVLESDQKLWTNASTRTYAQRYSGRVGSLQGLRFNVEFGRAMVKMGNIGVKTGSKWHSFVSTLAGLPDDCPLKRPRQLATGPCSRYGCPLKKCVINGCQSDTSNSTQATWT
ncbi:hypothetical protein AAC387_Pa04g2952 [Persea americana]